MTPDELNAIRKRDAQAISPSATSYKPRETAWEGRAQKAEAEVEQLTRWKTEMLHVLTGLQELGDALGLRLGEEITGDKAAEAVRKLKAENAQLRERLEQAWVAVDEIDAMLLAEWAKHRRAKPYTDGDEYAVHIDHLRIAADQWATTDAALRLIVGTRLADHAIERWEADHACT